MNFSPDREEIINELLGNFSDDDIFNIIKDLIEYRNSPEINDNVLKLYKDFALDTRLKEHELKDIFDGLIETNVKDFIYEISFSRNENKIRELNELVDYYRKHKVI